MFIISPTPAPTPAPQGVWDILSSGHLFQPCLSREALYLAAGVALLLVTDTLYANAYLQGAYLPARFSAGGCPSVWRALPVVPPGLCDTVTARRVRVSADRGVRGAVKIR